MIALKRNLRNPKILIFGLLILTGIITCIHPIYPNEQFLQHLGTVILLAIIAKDLLSNRLSLLAFTLFSMFILIHIIGARYIYSYVPYADWLNLVGIDMPFQEVRNGYDRFVHFASGMLLFPIIYESLSRGKVNGKYYFIFFIWALLQTIGMVYELFEWGLTLVLSPEAANDYNGQQGDMWDAQKDMFLAMVGSTFMAFIYIFGKVDKNLTH